MESMQSEILRCWNWTLLGLGSTKKKNCYHKHGFHITKAYRKKSQQLEKVEMNIVDTIAAHWNTII